MSSVPLHWEIGELKNFTLVYLVILIISTLKSKLFLHLKIFASTISLAVTSLHLLCALL